MHQVLCCQLHTAGVTQLPAAQARPSPDIDQHVAFEQAHIHPLQLRQLQD